MSAQLPQPEAPATDASPPPDHGTRGLRWAAAVALLGVVLIYNSLNPGSSDSALGAPAPLSSVTQVPPSAQAAASARADLGLHLPRSVPTHISIPAIGVSAPFTPLSVGEDNQLQAPPENNKNLAGYYADGPMPGELGSAIVAGHVDTKTGPAVFFLLSLLKPGSTAVITRADGSTATFAIDSVETFAKDNFPDQRVYGDTPDAELRIITCGGTFDRAKQDYKANTVVFAHLASIKQN
jgi:sortase (surface protein transpeptidase)